MEQIFNIIQIIIAVFLTLAILFQPGGDGAGSAFGGGSGGVYYRKRGFEKILFVSSIVLGTLFILIALLRIFI